MTTKVHAIYRHGVFQHATPSPVAEGAEVDLIITTTDQADSVAASLEEIARLPIEGAQDDFSGADHDRILYNSNLLK